MGALNIFLGVTIVALLVIGIILFVIYLVKWKKPLSLGKHITNHLHRFTEGHKYGSLIKREPVGNDKDMIRIKFTVKKKDEHDDINLKEQIVIARKNHIIEDKHGITILPRDASELNLKEPSTNDMIKKVEEANSIDLIAEGTKTFRETFARLFKANFGGELTETQIEKLLELKGSDDKKDDDEKEKDKK